MSSSTLWARSSSYLAPLAGRTGSGLRPRISSSTICEIDTFFEDDDDDSVHDDNDDGGDDDCRDLNLEFDCEASFVGFLCGVYISHINCEYDNEVIYWVLLKRF